MTTSAMSPAAVRRECDLVMKGGVTSGVVYPPAIYAITRTFDLRSIGGTSAGAIAAALASAAEYRRVADPAAPEAGYEQLRELPAWLGRDRHLFGLFTPNRSTRRLFDTLVALVAPGRDMPHRLADLLAAYRTPALLGGTPGLLHALCAGNVRDPGLRTLHLVASTFGFLAGATAGAAVALAMHAKRGLGPNLFGLVTGIDDDMNSPDTLCAWLAAKTEEIAGLPAGNVPLTFGMLWNPQAGPVANQLHDAPDDPRIDLRMQTTSIVEGRPYLFPTRTERYRFRADEMARFFPPHIVQWMIEHHRESTDPNAYTVEGQPLIPLPPIGDLPILVATRMSLAFPVLLSAVPLYTIEYAAGAAKDAPGTPHRVLFSDGGLTSNFPIGLFDAPLPRRPTLAMNLGGFPAESDEHTPDVVMASDNRPAEIYPPNDVNDLASFGGAIFGTMQNWNDALLAALPGFRDRIVTIRLRASEGGLNLDMDQATIDALVDRGRRAGEMLVERFATASTLQPIAGDIPMSWENHRWVRYRTFMIEIRDLLTRYAVALRSPAAGDVPYDSMIRADLAGTLPHRAYRLPEDPALRATIAKLSETLAQLGDELCAEKALEHQSPHPAATLRTAAHLDRV